MSALREVSTVEPTIEELAQIANDAHADVIGTVRTVLGHVLRAGEALIAIKDRVPEGEFGAWVDEGFRGSRTMAYDYMRITRHRELVPADVTIMEARQLVRGLPSVYSGKPIVRYSPEIKAEAFRLRDLDWGYKKIAAELGLSVSTVYTWLTGASSAERRKKAQRALRQQERERDIKRAVRKAGASLSEAYAMAERMQDVLGQAHGEAQDREVRAHLSLAGEHYRQMRDEIVKALVGSA